MNGQTTSNRVIDLLVSMLLLGFLSAAFVSCEETCYDGEQNNNEEAIDCGGPCVPCDTTEGTCFDGIQNQGELGVDCGGPCVDCITDTAILSPSFVCNGTGGSSYFPLSDGSYWIYAMPANDWFQLEIVGEVQQTNGEFYQHMVTTGSFGTIHDYYRDVNGQIYRWNTNLEIEEVYLPSNPTEGFQWTTSSADSIVINDVSATLNSQNGCEYEDLLQVTSYTSGNASTSYYKQGLGLVELSGASAYLDSAVVY
jgi:hypothetical protein